MLRRIDDLHCRTPGEGSRVDGVWRAPSNERTPPTIRPEKLSLGILVIGPTRRRHLVEDASSDQVINQCRNGPYVTRAGTRGA